MIDHLTRLARIVYALRQGETVTSGPFTDDSRRRVTTTQEWFYKGFWRVSRADELMHRNRVQMGSSTATAGETAEATDWAPQAIMQASVHWNADELEKLPALPAPGTDRIVDQIMTLADGEWHPLGVHTARIVADPSDDACPWTLEDRLHSTASMLQPLDGVLAELVFARP
jgi:hypothetical protein